MPANLILLKLDVYPSYEKEKGVRMPIDILHFPRESFQARFARQLEREVFLQRYPTGFLPLNYFESALLSCILRPCQPKIRRDSSTKR